MEWNLRTVFGAIMLVISGGVCGYALSHLIPDVYEHSQKYYALTLLQGIGFVAMAAILISNVPLVKEVEDLPKEIKQDK